MAPTRQPEAQAQGAGPLGGIVKLYQFRECHECGLVRRLLRQANLPFEAVTLPAGDKGIVRAKFKSESVPVLEDGAFVSNDLTAICRHVQGKASQARSFARPSGKA